MGQSAHNQVELSRTAIGATALVACAIGAFATPYMGVASFAYALICLGLVYRRQRKVHALLMNSGIVLDLSLVLILEIARDAVNTAIGMSLGPLQQAHIYSSAIAVVLYIPAFVLGWRALLYKLGPSGISWHRRLALTAFGFRSIGFALMFTLLDKPSG